MSLPEPRIASRALLLALAFIFFVTAAAATSPPSEVPVPDEGVWERSTREGQTAIGNSEWKVAVAAFGMAVHHAESFGADDPRLVDSLMWLSRALRAGKKLHEALPPLTRAVELGRSSSRYLTLETAKLLEEAGRARAGVGEISEAAKLFREAIEIRGKVQGVTHLDLVQPLDQLARWLEPGDPDEAEALLRRALAVSESSRGPHHREVGRLLDLLGNIHRDQGRHETAIDLYGRALEIEARRADVNRDIVIYRTQNVTREYRRLKRFEEAVEAYRDLIAMTRAHKGARHPDVALGLSGLGSALRESGDPTAAEPVFREALEIAEVAWGPDHPFTEGTRRDLMRLLDDRGVAHGLGEDAPYTGNPAYPRLSEQDRRFMEEIDRLKREDDLPGAIAQGERWLATVRSAQGEQALRLTAPLRHLAPMLERRGLMGEALETRVKMIEVLSLHVAEGNSAYQGALHEAGDLLARLGRPEEAIGYYESELSLREAQGESNPAVARLLLRMGATLDQVEHGLGEAYFHRAAEAWERIAGPDAPERSMALMMLAQSYVAQENLGAAEVLLTELLARFESDTPSNPASTIGVLQTLRLIYRKTGRLEAAAAANERLTALQKQLHH
jgi:tetratricopeptide (TPR) repeat protein